MSEKMYGITTFRNIVQKVEVFVMAESEEEATTKAWEQCKYGEPSYKIIDEQWEEHFDYEYFPDVREVK